MNDRAAIPAAAVQPRLLCVDDEANILNSLKRLLRPHGFEVMTVTSASAALELLKQVEVDLVISDMRMPEMDGAQFLERVRQHWPNTLRILLTGYADNRSTIAAINQGGIFRYVAKPWVDSEMVMVVQQAIELRTLMREKARLEALTRKQNIELQTLNAGLEEVVAQRTAELQKTMSSLEEAHARLKKGFINSITVFANLIALRQGAAPDYSRKVTDLARRIAGRMRVPDPELQNITIAAMLCDIGKLGLPDRIAEKAFNALSMEERSEVMKHPVRGQAALMALEQLTEAARLIRSQHERFDGGGFPDRIGGFKIPRGACILAVANDFYGLQYGRISPTRYTQARAHAYIVEGRGSRYNPEAVDAFVEVMGPVVAAAAEFIEEKIPLNCLEGGMVLARDLSTEDGMLLLCAEHVLDAGLIQQIRGYDRAGGSVADIYVRKLKRR